jgi:hypothetical protein
LKHHNTIDIGLIGERHPTLSGRRGRAQKGAGQRPPVEPREQAPRNLLLESVFLSRVACWLFHPFRWPNC